MSLWSAVREELALWRADGRVLPVWWRDDDAVAATPELDRLAQEARAYGLRVDLAVIPGRLEPSLAPALAEGPFSALVHGLRHENHAPADHKKAEFGDTRPLSDRLIEAHQGLATLRARIGAPLLPVFVPPWNRIGADMAPGLAQIGYRGLSTFRPRAAVEAAPGLVQLNTHLDPIDWRGTRSAVAPEAFAAETLRLLEDRRRGRTDAGEPLGLLTHHLVHDAAIWSLVRAFWEVLLEGPVEPVALEDYLPQGRAPVA
ncbi:polysaccharide deacetylase family protein [Pseudooceanicola nanhaiensis]|uniref:polysaccharide deacetylase family protein n=1 Tax=Pseudooceanicola nanhaiensis TaxID=375761 RepID=UPI001CD674BD|nr:polysaccharide deacetylase family protein [Pseudooceanicola nanhaiensis]MCA0919171.1 polysaccharide deacetylase family protein [Pseudooceanicola nanhaiensis]